MTVVLYYFTKLWQYMMLINTSGMPILEISLNVVFKVIYVPTKLIISINTYNQ